MQYVNVQYIQCAHASQAMSNAIGYICTYTRKRQHKMQADKEPTYVFPVCAGVRGLRDGGSYGDYWWRIAVGSSRR